MNKMLMAGLMSIAGASAAVSNLMGVAGYDDVKPFDRKKMKKKTSHKDRSKQKQARASRKKNRG